MTEAGVRDEIMPAVSFFQTTEMHSVWIKRGVCKPPFQLRDETNVKSVNCQRKPIFRIAQCTQILDCRILR